MRVLRLFTVLLFALSLAPSALAQSDSTDPFAVTVQGDTLRGDVELKDPLLGRRHVLIDGERREIDEFSYLQVDGDLLAVVDGRGLAKLVQDGRVRFYSRSEYSPGTPGFGVPGTPGAVAGTPGGSTEYGYIQIGDGPVQDATTAALRQAFQDNPESMRQLDRMRTLSTTRWIVTGLGVAAFVTGAALMIQAEENGEDYTPYAPIVVGGGVAIGVSNFVFPTMISGARRQAIDAYNRD